MVHLDRLSKYFGAQKAVDALRFEIPAGQIVGFLGPNGAGTTVLAFVLSALATWSRSLGAFAWFIGGEALLTAAAYAALRLLIAHTRWPASE